jgi:hypothetical protein
LNGGKMDKEKELITECLKNQTKLIKEQTKVLTNLAIKNQLLKNEIKILKTRVKNSEKIIFYLNRTVLIILIILLLKV